MKDTGMIEREELRGVLFHAICDRRFPSAVAIDLPVMKLLEDEAGFYADAVLASLTTREQNK